MKLSEAISIHIQDGNYDNMLRRDSWANKECWILHDGEKEYFVFSADKNIVGFTIEDLLADDWIVKEI